MRRRAGVLSIALLGLVVAGCDLGGTGPDPCPDPQENGTEPILLDGDQDVVGCMSDAEDIDYYAATGAPDGATTITVTCTRPADVDIAVAVPGITPFPAIADCTTGAESAEVSLLGALGAAVIVGAEAEADGPEPYGFSVTFT